MTLDNPQTCGMTFDLDNLRLSPVSRLDHCRLFDGRSNTRCRFNLAHHPTVHSFAFALRHTGLEISNCLAPMLVFFCPPFSPPWVFCTFEEGQGRERWKNTLCRLWGFNIKVGVQGFGVFWGSGIRVVCVLGVLLGGVSRTRMSKRARTRSMDAKC